MNILITNDDGYNSEGIIALRDILSREHKVYLVAPLVEKSACSNAITIRKELDVKKIADDMYAVDGYTADCVNVGLNSGLVPEVEMVISGINHGPNLGDDIHFSGTFAGARTAHIFGLSGIAISLDCLSQSNYFQDAALFILDFIGKINAQYSGVRHLYNINYPDLPSDEIMGVKHTRLGKRFYNDYYEFVDNGGSSMTLRLQGTIESHTEEGCDITELRNGFITVTPISLDCTDYAMLKKSG